MVDRYDPGMSYDPQPDGEYVLYSDHAALCDAVNEWAKATNDYEATPCDQYWSNVLRAEADMLDLANK